MPALDRALTAIATTLVAAGAYTPATAIPTKAIPEMSPGLAPPLADAAAARGLGAYVRGRVLRAHRPKGLPHTLWLASVDWRPADAATADALDTAAAVLEAAVATRAARAAPRVDVEAALKAAGVHGAQARRTLALVGARAGRGVLRRVETRIRGSRGRTCLYFLGAVGSGPDDAPPPPDLAAVVAAADAVAAATAADARGRAPPPARAATKFPGGSG